MTQEEIDEMMVRYRAICKFANKVGGRTNDLRDWVSDVSAAFNIHGLFLSRGDRFEAFFGPFAHFFRLNDDTEGIGLCMLRWRGGNMFGWETVDLTDPQNDMMRAIMSDFFNDYYGEYYTDDLKMVKPFEKKK